MKRSITLITLITLLLIGITACTDNNNIINQDSSYDQLSLAKKKDKDPANKIYTASKRIDGKKGGIISLKVSMDKRSGTKSEVKLIIPKGAFRGKEVISFFITPGSPVVEFSPHGLIFKKELKLNVKLENFWFGKEDQLDFAYLDELGNKLEDVEYESLTFNSNKNYIKVKKARIGHFSRYGFSR